MSNHVHLLATEQRTEALADTIQAMGRRYVSYFNFLHRRTGTLWEGRYRSTLIESERYLLRCQRYIEMNPVRAGLVLRPEDFHWSSHRYHVAGVADDLVTPHTMFLSLGESEAVRRRAYAALFEAQALDDEIQSIRDAVNKGWAMGSDEFCRDLERLTGRATSPRPLGRPRKTHDPWGGDAIFTE
jgi:putative transposase